MMHRRTALAVVAMALLPRAVRAANTRLDFLLANYVHVSADTIARVDYARWKASPSDLAALDTWIVEESRRRPSVMDHAQAFAFWANLYNALTLKVVLYHYPIRSIRDIRSTGVFFDPKGWAGPWRTRLVTVEGQHMSLDDIEHGTMRPVFRDPRVHYAVNCASIGCPDLGRQTWQAATLDVALDAAARRFVNHPRAVSVLADGRLRVSSIYHWFREDFGGSDAGIIAHLRRHAAPALATRLDEGARIADHAYDWTLNDTGSLAQSSSSSPSTHSTTG